MDNIWSYLGDAGITWALTLIAGALISYIKKGDLKNWGIVVGKAISTFADAKIGKGRWEKLEDALTVGLVTFAIGVKEGADYDDADVEKVMDKIEESKKDKK